MIRHTPAARTHRELLEAGLAMAEENGEAKPAAGFRQALQSLQAEPVKYAPPDYRLAECPCCGSLDVGGNTDRVYCYSCGLTMIKPPPLQNSIDAWNTRKPCTPQPAKVPEAHVIVPRRDVESAINALRYGSHPHRSPHADDLEKAMLTAAPAAGEGES